jgi:hypothetical protein
VKVNIHRATQATLFGDFVSAVDVSDDITMVVVKVN